MSPSEPARPKVNLLPSTQEDLHAYMAAIRNRMDAEKTRLDREKRAAYADSYGRHHPFPLSTDATTPGGPGPVPVLNQTSPSTLHTLATRNPIKCESHLGFKEHAACGRYEAWIVLAFFILFWTIFFSWTKYRKPATRQLDEENNGNATWPRSSHICTNCRVDQLEDRIRKLQRENRGAEEEVGAQQYEPVAWRSASRRAERANVGGTVEHGGLVAELPSL